MRTLAFILAAWTAGIAAGAQTVELQGMSAAEPTSLDVSISGPGAGEALVRSSSARYNRSVAAQEPEADTDEGFRAFTINYQYVGIKPDEGDTENFGLGVGASYVHGLTPKYGFAADVGLSSKSLEGTGTTLTLTTYQAGLAIKSDGDSTTRLLVGIANFGVERASTNETMASIHFYSGQGFTFGLGGGAIFAEDTTLLFWRVSAGWTW